MAKTLRYDWDNELVEQPGGGAGRHGKLDRGLAILIGLTGLDFYEEKPEKRQWWAIDEILVDIFDKFWNLVDKFWNWLC